MSVMGLLATQEASAATPPLLWALRHTCPPAAAPASGGCCPARHPSHQLISTSLFQNHLLSEVCSGHPTHVLTLTSAFVSPALFCCLFTVVVVLSPVKSCVVHQVWHHSKTGLPLLEEKPHEEFLSLLFTDTLQCLRRAWPRVGIQKTW